MGFNKKNFTMLLQVAISAPFANRNVKMGIEWDIGCTTCKKFIWLGSMKSYKWKGFQIGTEQVLRFLKLHSTKNGCELFISSDHTDDVPWEENSSYMEDILSRSFCFESFSQDGVKCGYCGEVILGNKENKLFEEELNKSLEEPTLIRKGRMLWFCSESCSVNFIKENKGTGEHSIYDSTNDKPEIDGEFKIIMDSGETLSVPKNPMEEESFKIAEFLSDHIGKKLKIEF